MPLNKSLNLTEVGSVLICGILACCAEVYELNEKTVVLCLFIIVNMYVGLPILKYFLHLMSYPAGLGETKKENYILKFNFPGFTWYLTKKINK